MKVDEIKYNHNTADKTLMAQKKHTANLTELRSTAGLHPEHAGMAVQSTHGSRSTPAAGSGEKRTS